MRTPNNKWLHNTRTLLFTSALRKVLGESYGIVWVIRSNDKGDKGE